MFLHCTGTETLIRKCLQDSDSGPWPSPRTAVTNIQPHKAPGVCTVPWEFPEGVPAPCSQRRRAGGSGPTRRGWGMWGTHVLEAPVEALQLLLGELGLCLQLVKPLWLVAHCGQLSSLSLLSRGTRGPGGVEYVALPISLQCGCQAPGGSKRWGDSPRVTTRYGCPGCALHKWTGCSSATHSSCASWSLCCPAPHTQWALPAGLTWSMPTLSAICWDGGGRWE